MSEGRDTYLQVDFTGVAIGPLIEAIEVSLKRILTALEETAPIITEKQRDLLPAMRRIQIETLTIRAIVKAARETG
jgi:hypothetical protein